MTFVAEHDVVVLGAGPGGISAAIRLAEMGLDVGVIERHRFPRSHVGICIADETIALIDSLGLGREFDEARFWRRDLTAVRWGDFETRLVPQKGYHLDRGLLDWLMVRKSRAVGVKVYQPARIEKVERPRDSRWSITVACDEGRRLLRARFVVDAGGRRSAIRGARIKDGPPLVSIHASWALRKAAAFDGLIEAGEDAWLWYAQTRCDRAVVSVFCDPRRLGAGRKDGMQAKYSGLLRQFRALEVEQLGRQCSDPRVCDASSHHAADAIGDRYIRLGDACFSVDPLSSQGVHLALQSGLQGAIVINTMLRKPENTEAAQQFFRTRIAERITRYAGRTAQEYARVLSICPNAFWRERAGAAAEVEADLPHHLPLEPSVRPPSDQVAVSPDLTLDQAPVIDGTFVEIGRVVRHPNIDGAIAYVDGVDLVRLLSALPPKFAYSDISGIWSDHIPPATGDRIASWLWSRRVLVAAA
jgi:flavin-dependent dehydrogenase